MSTPTGGSGVHVFSRQSSGLVRQVGTIDTMWYSLVQVAVQFFFFIPFWWAAYPGASMEVAILFVTVGTCGSAIVYGLYSAVYPRSGGEYIFITRSIHPGLGFACSFSLAFWQAQSVGTTAALVSIYALAPFFSALGVQLHSQTLLALANDLGHGWAVLIVGLADMALMGYLLFRGMKLYFTVQRWMVIVAFVSLGATLLVFILGAIGVLNFQANFDALLGHGAYAKVLADAHHAGASLAPSFSAKETANFAIWPAESIIFGLFAVAFAGEVKNPARNQLVGILGGVIMGGLLLTLLAFLARVGIGGDFIRAASYLVQNDPKAWILPNAYVPLLASILGGNPVITVIVNLWFIILSLLLVAAVAIYASRAILAWGIDGTVPDALGDVSERFHTPTWALAVTFGIGVVTLVLFSFTTVFNVLSGIIGMGSVFFLVSLAGIFFPFYRRKMFEESPANIKIGPVPLMSIGGVVGASFLGFILYRAFVDNIAGVNAPSTLILSGAVYVVGFAWFYSFRWWRRRRGVNLDLRFKEIPVE